MTFENILCVCTGNICRSPLAEAYLAQGLPTSTVTSAGTHALVGEPADDKALEVAQSRGLQLGEHRARQLDEAIAREQDLILVMEKGQLEWVQSHYPFARGMVFLLSQWRDRDDVSDPYRHAQGVFDTVYERIQRCADDWMSRLQPEKRA